MRNEGYNFKLKDLELFCDAEICARLNLLFSGNTDIDKYGMVEAMNTMNKKDREWVLIYFLHIEKEISRRQRCYKITQSIRTIALLDGILVFLFGIMQRLDEPNFYIISLIMVTIFYFIDLYLHKSIRRKIIFHQF